MEIILASSSKARKKLLKLLDISFKTVPSDVDEESIVGKTPLETIKLRAKEKAEKVCNRIENQELRIKNKFLQPTTHHLPPTTYLILSADSMAVLSGKLIGKPKDKKEAKKILQLLSDHTHHFITAIYCILITQNRNYRYNIVKKWQQHEESLVTFRKLSDNDINLYLSLTKPSIYAAGYAISDTPQNFIIKIEGSISNVMGLPLEKIIPILLENKVMQFPLKSFPKK